MRPSLLSLRSLHALLLILITGLLNTEHCSAAPKLNVLFLMADDLRPELGCYGNKLILTPNLDKLAGRSVRFDRAYVQFPLCNPSRASLLTGRYPTTTGVLENTTWWGALHPDWVSLPRHFKNNGFAALRSGKIFHGGIDDADAWTEGGEARKFEGATNTAKKGQVAANSDRIVKLDGDGESHADFKTATRAIEYLERHKDKPFFLACGFTKPHSPPTAPQKFFDLYDVTKIPLPPDFAAKPAAPTGFPEASVPKRNSDLFIGRDASESESREVIRAYWASASFMDAQAGRVLAALDRLGLREKTIVLFWGDHGYHLGEKGKWSKHGSLFEIGTRVPLLISAPGMKGNGQVSPRIVETVDLFPTLNELCGLPKLPGLQGDSLVPLLNNPQAAWSHPAFTVSKSGPLGLAVRTERWRYAEYDGGKSGAMLFDEQADPHELKNLADDPKHAKTVAELKELLKRVAPAK
ncbi:MAG: sulfatase [Limisphaerales bacterium]